MQDSNKYTPREATQALLHAVDTICDLNKTNSEIINNNILLNQKLSSCISGCSRMTQAAIYYDATYSGLPEDLRREFDRIGEQVIKDFDLKSLM